MNILNYLAVRPDKNSRIRLSFLLCPILVLFCIACGNALEGKVYTDKTGIVKLEFKDDGIAHIVTMGTTMESPYKVEDGKVSLTISNQTVILSLEDDGALVGFPMAGRLTEVED